MVEEMREKGLSYWEITRQYKIRGANSVADWERIYLEEGPEGLLLNAAAGGERRTTTEKTEAGGRRPSGGSTAVESWERIPKNWMPWLPRGYGKRKSKSNMGTKAHKLSMLLDIAGPHCNTYYYYTRRQKAPDKYAQLKEEICSSVTENKGRYGYRKVTQELQNRGFHHNHKFVAKLMKNLGLTNKVWMKKYRSYKGEVGKIAPNLLIGTFVQTSRTRNVSRVTEFGLFGEKLFLSPILGLHSGDLISYTISDWPVLSMLTNMPDKAFERIPDDMNLALHSNQGWEYRQKHYQKLTEDKGVRKSMSRKGNCLDNAVKENFFVLLKTELLYLQDFDSLEHFKAELVDYL